MKCCFTCSCCSRSCRWRSSRCSYGSAGKPNGGYRCCLCIADGVAGALLWRWQGLRAIVRIQEEMAAGKMPADSLVDGLLIFLAGALLITPGMLTDLAGFALLIPPIRAVVKRFAKAWFIRHVQVRTAAAFHTTPPPTSGPATDGDKIIEARVIGTRVENVP